MEISIIIGLVLIILILFFLLIGTRVRKAEVARLQAVLGKYKRKENDITRREAARLEAVFRKKKQQENDIRKIEVEVVRLQTTLDKEKRGKMKLQAEVIRLQNRRPFSNFKQPPPAISYTDDYWQALSSWYRQEKDWTCEECGINLRKRTFFLHAHHVYGREYNAPEYLKALCIICHAEEPNHSFMKNAPEYQRFLRTPVYQGFVRNRRIRQ